MAIAASRPSWRPWGMRVVGTGFDARSRSARSLAQALAVGFQQSSRSADCPSKTALKYLSQPASDISIKAQHRFIRAVPIPRQSIELSRTQMEKGFTVPTITSWLGLLELSRLNPAVLNYWKDKLYALSELSGQVIRSMPNKHDRFFAYTSSEVLELLGCPASRQSMLGLLHDLREEELLRSTALAQLMSADSWAALLRLAAWFMADSQVANWEFEVEEGTQNVIRATWVIPKWCVSTQSWSNLWRQHSKSSRPLQVQPRKGLGLSLISESSGLHTMAWGRNQEFACFGTGYNSKEGVRLSRCFWI